MSDELRAAVERLMNPKARNDRNVLNSWWPVMIRDLTVVANAYVEEHPADSETPIDDEWLRSVKGRKHEWHPDKWEFYRDDALPVGLWRVDDGWKAMLIYAEHAASCIRRGLKTRGDFRKLASALGIELEEKPQ